MSATINLDTANTIFEVALGAIAVGAAVLAGMKRIIRHALRDIREDTKQLRHNGGSHVADYARDARDIAKRVERQVSDLAELVDDAGQTARDAAATANEVRADLAEHIQEDAAHRRPPRRWRNV